jgi:hypothetical protein
VIAGLSASALILAAACSSGGGPAGGGSTGTPLTARHALLAAAAQAEQMTSANCAGCDHFRTDVSYLPDLTAYLDDLLRTRERLAAAIDGVDDWARADATPAEEEITRIRRLISRIQGDIAQLPATERAHVDQAVTVIRKHRAVNLGIPAVRPGAMRATRASA